MDAMAIYGPILMMFVGMLLFVAFQILGKLITIDRRLAELAPPLELSAAAKLLADDPRQKIAAIKTVREESGVGLAEAKQAVEAYIRGRQS